jgi:AbrB family looped-hinge helix DNA binding protein
LLRAPHAFCGADLERVWGFPENRWIDTGDRVVPSDHDGGGEEPVAERALGLGINWYAHPMRTTVDAVGRIVVPKALRDALGLTPGSTVDISRYGNGLQLIPDGRTARIVEEDGVPVATGKTVINDEDVFGLLDAGRR